MSTIGSKIKKIREIKGWTQEAMADKVGMSVQGYGKLERDEADIPFSRLEQISTVFNMKPEDLICFDEKNVFNNYGSAHDKSFSVNYQVSDKERELYERNIKLLEDKIQYLTEQLQKTKL
jgi:transcriptional regulator with XRE-family HTH domain